MSTYVHPHSYRVGEAVFYLYKRSQRIRDFAILPGQIVRVGKRITIKTEAGRKVVGPMSLAYAGHCPQCMLPALAGSPMVCPQCERPAEPTPPPYDLLAVLFPPWSPAADPYTSPAFINHAAALALVTGQPVNAAIDAMHEWRWARLRQEQALVYERERPEPTREDLLEVRAVLVELLAMLDEELGAVDGTGLGIELPPRWAAPEDDQQPDASTSDPIAALLRRLLGEGDEQ